MAGSYPFLLVLALGLLRLVWRWGRRQPLPPHPASVRAPVQRRLEPRAPRDGPAWRQGQAIPAVERRTRPRVRPRPAVTGQRAAPARTDPRGFARDTPVGASCGGTPGQLERIRTFRWPAGGHPCTPHRHTPRDRLTAVASRVADVRAALAEGREVAAAVRVVSPSEATIAPWPRRAGRHRAALPERVPRDLPRPPPGNATSSAPARAVATGSPGPGGRLAR